MRTLNTAQAAILRRDHAAYDAADPSRKLHTFQKALTPDWLQRARRRLNMQKKSSPSNLVRSLLVDALIIADETPFDEDHRDALEAMSDDVLQRLCLGFGIGAADDEDKKSLRAQRRPVVLYDNVAREMMPPTTLDIIAARLPDEQRDALLSRATDREQRLHANERMNALAARKVDEFARSASAAMRSRTSFTGTVWMRKQPSRSRQRSSTLTPRRQTSWADARRTNAG
jgi:hypothetical protein